jgi:antitoxin CptB
MSSADATDPAAGGAAPGLASPGRASPGRAELGRLRWRCRRGLRELDELLTRYVDREYAAAPAAHQAAFRTLLDSHDPVIYAYFLGRQTPADPVLSSLIERIIAGAGND